MTVPCRKSCFMFCTFLTVTLLFLFLTIDSFWHARAFEPTVDLVDAANKRKRTAALSSADTPDGRKPTCCASPQKFGVIRTEQCNHWE